MIEGDPITYTVTASNLGPDAAYAVVLTDTLPAGVIYGSATSDQSNVDRTDGVIACNLGTITNTATVAGRESDHAGGRHCRRRYVGQLCQLLLLFVACGPVERGSGVLLPLA